MTFPEPPTPPQPAPSGYSWLGELVGQTIDVKEVEQAPSDGLAVLVLVDGRKFICAGEWSNKCASVLQAELRARNADHMSVRVVEEKGQVGLRE